MEGEGREGREEERRKGEGEWDAGLAGQQVPGAPHW